MEDCNFVKGENERFNYSGDRVWFISGDPKLKLNGVIMNEGETYEIHPNDYIEIYQIREDGT